MLQAVFFAAFVSWPVSWHSPSSLGQVGVSPTVETAAVPSKGDAADDVVIWVHPLSPELSTVIGTDKDSGLVVYDLAGRLLHHLPDGKLVNVDLRYDFPLGGTEVALVAAGEREPARLRVYAVERETRGLREVATRPLKLGFDVYGSCMYRSRVTGETYYFGTSKSGKVEQWRLFDDGTGRVDAVRVRAFDAGGQCEGCVADDETGALFVGEEKVGIWRYGAEPDDGSTRVQVDRTGAGGRLEADVEGLALFHTGPGEGYLIASSQGNNSFAVYDRAVPHTHRLNFRILDNPQLGIDGVSGTDGIDVTNLALGPAFPGGLFVAQDDTNPKKNQNFKLVPWSAIAKAANPPLDIDPTHDALGAGIRSDRPGKCSGAEQSWFRSFGPGALRWPDQACTGAVRPTSRGDT